MILLTESEEVIRLLPERHPSTDATLTARLIDRPIRPMFAEGFRNEVQVINTVPVSYTHLDVYKRQIPRYVDTFEEEEVEPLTEIVSKINETNQAIQNQTVSLLEMLNQLHGTTPEADAELKEFLKEFKG